MTQEQEEANRSKKEEDQLERDEEKKKGERDIALSSSSSPPPVSQRQHPLSASPPLDSADGTGENKRGLQEGREQPEARSSADGGEETHLEFGGKGQDRKERHEGEKEDELPQELGDPTRSFPSLRGNVGDAEQPTGGEKKELGMKADDVNEGESERAMKEREELATGSNANETGRRRDEEKERESPPPDSVSDIFKTGARRDKETGEPSSTSVNLINKPFARSREERNKLLSLSPSFIYRQVQQQWQSTKVQDAHRKWSQLASAKPETRRWSRVERKRKGGQRREEDHNDEKKRDVLSSSSAHPLSRGEERTHDDLSILGEEQGEKDSLQSSDTATSSLEEGRGKEEHSLLRPWLAVEGEGITRHIAASFPSLCLSPARPSAVVPALHLPQEEGKIDEFQGATASSAGELSRVARKQEEKRVDHDGGKHQEGARSTNKFRRDEEESVSSSLPFQVVASSSSPSLNSSKANGSTYFEPGNESLDEYGETARD